MRALVDMAADRGAYIDQSQSLNLFIESPSIGKLSSMYMYAWKKGLKTTYYLRSRPATSIAKTTVTRSNEAQATADAQTLSEAGAQASANQVNAGTNATVSSAASSAVSASVADAAKAALAREAALREAESAAIACSLENPEACEACQ
jgi:ribonucleoside-diphosphate reductase alpha chain